MREYLLVLFVAMATTFLLTGVARKIALRYGAVAKVRSRDVHQVPSQQELLEVLHRSHPFGRDCRAIVSPFCGVDPAEELLPG